MVLSRAMATAGLAIALAVVCGVNFAVVGAAPPLPDCNNQFAQMVPCISFVEGTAAGAPSKACCSALQDVRAHSPVCLCELIAPGGAGGAGSAGGGASGINTTLALMLPGLCKVEANAGHCTALLNGTPIPAPSALPSSPKGEVPAAAAASGPSTAPPISTGGTPGSPSKASPSTLPAFSLLLAALAGLRVVILVL